jgi:hypothetical protein
MLRLRSLAIGLFVLTVIIAAASPTPAADGAPDTWRQTSQGWQHSEDFLSPSVEYRRPALHPAIVGSLEILLTMSALLALSNDRRAKVRVRKHAGRR